MIAAVTGWTESDNGLLFLLCAACWIVQAPPAFRRRTSTAYLSIGPLAVLAQLLWFFVKAGAFVFGNGLAIVPFLYGGVVREHGWLNDRQFLDAVAVAMLTPKPVVITVAFIRYLVACPPGALVVALGVFLPVYGCVVIAFRWFDRISHNPPSHGFCGRGYRRRFRRDHPRRHRSGLSGRRGWAHRPDRGGSARPLVALQGSGAPAHRGGRRARPGPGGARGRMTMRVRGLTLVATAMVNLRVGGASHRLANWRHGSGRRPLGRGIRSVHLPGKPDVRLGGEARECAGRRVRPDPLPRPGRAGRSGRRRRVAVTGPGRLLPGPGRRARGECRGRQGRTGGGRTDLKLTGAGPGAYGVTVTVAVARHTWHELRVDFEGAEAGVTLDGSCSSRVATRRFPAPERWGGGRRPTA